MISRATRVVAWSVYAAGWLIFCLLEWWALHVVQGLPRTAALISTITVAWPGVLAGILVWGVSGRLTWRRGIAKFVWAQFFLALLFSAYWQGAIHLQLIAFLGPHEAWKIVRGFFFWQLQFGAIVYGAVAFLFYGVRTLSQLREEERRAQQAEVLRTRAELEALKGKLQPHFLFNTLHTLTALVRTDPKQAERALLKLGDVLRYVLQIKQDGAADEVPLAEEWNFVQQYLAIEQIRLGDRLRIQSSMTRDALECAVPIFALQPIVENAIHYAIAPRAEGGTLKITGRVDNRVLELNVEDDGPGADPDVVENSKGFGLRVVRQRLALRFPGEGRVAVTTGQGKGFRVRLTCPAVEAGA